MDPPIQYVNTSDDVSIAYYVMGDGPSIVRASTTFGSHLLLERSIPENRPGMEALERRHRIVRYDGRGSGLSQRESSDFSLASRLLDLEAVVEHLGLESFALEGPYHFGLAAVAYAVRHPKRITHLILSNSFARGRERYEASPATRARLAMRPVTNEEWEYYALSAASADFQFSDTERAKERAALIQASMEPSAMVAFRDATLEIDVTDLLPQIRVPTLVICRPSRQYTQPKSSQLLASRIPGAQLAVLESWSGTGIDEDWLRTIGNFLGDLPPQNDPRGAEERREGASPVRTILFTDLVGHTEMMSRLGDERGRDVLREHERITREVLKANSGTEVKTMGDGFMASFGSVTKAVECAIALQRAFADREGHPLSIRVGLNAGEPIEEDGDLFGATVILASRIAAKAAGGEILVADTVRGLCSGKGFLFADRGYFVAKGIQEPVRLFEVEWRDTTASL